MNTGKYISFIEDVISLLRREDLAEKADQYAAMLDDIKKREGNPCFNVALIGDFSSGKSTFINTFIQRRLLKTAWLATTAIPTFIFYHDENYIKIVAEVTDGKKYRVDLPEEKKLLEQILGSPLPEKVEDVIAELTTNNNFADRIKRVGVWTCADEQLKNICIIDTPGVNPGAENTKRHIEVTRGVLHDYADATIVLFQSSMVYTHTFQNFLHENAMHFMDNAIFIITMMDLQDEDSRGELLEFVRERLRVDFSLENPMVYGCSAKLAATEYDRGNNGAWVGGFDTLKRETIKYVNTNRNAIVQSNLKILIENILKGLDEEVQNCLDTVSRRLEILEKNSISHLSEDMRRNESEYLIKIDGEYAKTDFEAEYKLMFSDIQRKAYQAIDACTKIRGEGYDSIDGYIKDGFPSMAKYEQDVFSRKINSRLLAVNGLLSEYVAADTELFNAYNVALNYSKSAAVAEKRKYSYNVDKLQIDSHSMTETVTEKVTVAVGVVAMAPFMLVDSLFKTDYANKVADKIDSWFNSGVNFFCNLEKRKQTAKNKLKEQTDRMRDEHIGEFLKQIDGQKERLKQSMEEVIENFKSEYEKIYSLKQAEFESEKTIIENRRRELEQTHRQLKEYLKEIS